MPESGSKHIEKLREKIDAGEVEMSDNLVKAIKLDWFGNVHPSLAKARIKQIPHSWFDLEALNEQETEVFDRWVHKGWDAEKIAGNLRRSKESVETDLFVIKNKLRMTQEPNKGDWQNFLLLSGRGFGKLLRTDLPLPTPSGWTTMGDVNIGDELLDEEGNPTTVIDKTPVRIPDKAYELYFDDGSFMEACDKHQWVTWTQYDRKAYLRSQYVDDHTNFPDNWPQWRSKQSKGGAEPKVYPKYSKGPEVRTTQDIVDTLYYGKRDDRNHSIPLTKPLQLQERDLEVDPYILGLWLGDGARRGTTLYVDDKEIITRLKDRGVKIKEYKTAKDECPAYKIGKDGREPDSIHQNLKRLDLINNKHIPQKYLRGSISQRLELLQGIMDTDGWVEKGKSVAITQKRKRLSDDIKELIVSLGMKARQRKRKKTSQNGTTGIYHQISFHANKNVFKLSRKAEKLDYSASQQLRYKHRMIINAEEVEPSPMQCITVDSPNSMYLAGREMIPTHNTRSGAELVKEYVRRGWAQRIALISPTPGKARDDLLRKLDSGLLQIYPEGQEPNWLPTKKRVDWKNGSEANIYSGANPEEIRGPEFDLAWVDEFAAFKYPRETWDNLQFALRLGDHPQTIITTTPKPIPTLIDIVKDEHTIISKGSTYENKENLPQSFYDHVVSKYEGTTIGQQEIYADILSDSKRALWSRNVINDFRLENSSAKDVMKRCDRIVVGIDPAVGDKKENDETGIVVAGATNDTGWVLEDSSMSQARPQAWADKAINLFHKYQADKIIAETNQGGQMVEQTLRTVDSNIPYKGVRASKGKRTRAEPVAALYEQGKVHHVGVLGTLEDQLVTWEPGHTKSPDRLDALVYSLSELMLGGRDRKQGWSMYV